MSAGIGFASAKAVSKKDKEKAIKEQKDRVKKFKQYYDILLGWLDVKQKGKSLSDYFEKKQYYKIAIYGMGELGIKLYDELKNSNIEVVCAIDKGEAYENIEIDVMNVGEKIPDVDVVVVTPAFAYHSIEEELLDYLDCPIISIEDVVYEC